MPYCEIPSSSLWNKGLSRMGLRPDYLQHYFSVHTTAAYVKRIFPDEVYEDAFKFAFVRNPWDWQISLYHYMKQEPNHYQHDFINNMKSFEEYLYWRINEEKHLQKEFVTDENGEIIVDFIGKLENIDSDLKNICDKLNLNVSLQHENKSKHENYKTYYTDKTRDMVYEAFKEDIELFDYTF